MSPPHGRSREHTMPCLPTSLAINDVPVLQRKKEVQSQGLTAEATELVRNTTGIR